MRSRLVASRWLLVALWAGLALTIAPAAAAGIEIAWLEDPQGRLSIDEAAASDAAARYTPAGEGTLNFGLSASTYWLRITVPAGTPGTLLEIASPYIDWLDFHSARRDGGYDLIATGDHRPFATRGIAYRHPVFRVADGAGDGTVHYLRVRSDGALQLPLRLWSPEDFRIAGTQENLVFGVFYGLLVAMALYNLFLFVGVRDRAYLWYVVYVTLFGLFVFARNGFAFQWLWPGSAWLGNNAHYLLIAGAGAAAAQFTRQFLDTRSRVPRIDTALRGVAAFSLLVAAVTLAGWQRAAILLVQVHALAAVSVGIVAAVLVWRSGYAPARYYLLAFATLMTSGLFSVARNLGLFPSNFLSTYGVQIGSAVEVVLLALGLADRIRTLMVEKETAQAQALHSEHEALAVSRRAEFELEQRVRERTDELARANALLREREQVLERMAHHDGLTGLANRMLLEQRFDHALARARRWRTPVAALMIDLDRFKAINDEYGHDFGDAVLRAVAIRLCAAVRDTDTVARLGGDEFVVLLEDLHSDADCDAIAAKLLAGLGEPITHQGNTLRVTPSIGAAIHPGDGEDVETLLRNADQAMYAAKGAGRNGYHRASAAHGDTPAWRPGRESSPPSLRAT